MVNKNEIDKYINKIYNLCTKETCYSKVADKWSEDNKFYGHCAIITLLLHDKFGGKIKKGDIKEEKVSHYWNEIDGVDYDATICQYNYSPTIEGIKLVNKENLLSVISTKNRYAILKNLLGE